ncbi:MAG: hypothetical protein EA350_07320 [Gemmatimonadales bacterium]|nr:MAG: hypothetical protein EA350_07320 [Gemmatimonadales bacterium]
MCTYEPAWEHTMKDGTAEAETSAPSAGRPLWVYGYQMNPPQPEARMTAIRDLLDKQNDAVALKGRKWTACLVTEERVTHVLVVTSSPEENLDLNRRLESELKGMGIRFELSVPMPV